MLLEGELLKDCDEVRRDFVTHWTKQYKCFGANLKTVDIALFMDVASLQTARNDGEQGLLTSLERLPSYGFMEYTSEELRSQAELKAAAGRWVAWST